MFELKVENARNDVLTLTNNKNYIIDSIEGLTAPKANINITQISGRDGGRFNSATTETRNIVINICPRVPVEENRINLYKFFAVKGMIRVYFSNGTRDVYIDGFVEAVDGSLFEQIQTIQLSIICPDPYFYNITNQVSTASTTESLFEFPFAIEKTGIPFSEIVRDYMVTITNKGDVETGFIVEITCFDTVVNPTIYKADTGEFFGLATTINSGDKITVNTITGQKSVKKSSGGVATNIINSIIEGSTWLKMEAGDNIFSWTCDSGRDYVNMIFKSSILYEGV